MLLPWYKVVTAREEVREGRSFNPDEFAIALEQVVAGTAPADYCDPAKFFSRTCFTRALKEHAGLVLRRLAGQTSNTAPVLTLITQFGGGKTHTLTALHHIASNGDAAKAYPGIGDLAAANGLTSIPKARVAAFVGNAWDPKAGRETPWMDLAWQIAGDAGVKLLGPHAREVPPGTETLADVFRAAHQPVLVLMDEVLNFLDRNKQRDPGVYDAFHAFIQNLTVALTGLPNCAAVISLPRSQVEMSQEDRLWQDKITKVVKRVAKDLIVADEAEIGEVIRRRLFDDLGPETTRRKVAKEYAEWCFQRRAELPPEWFDVDTATSESKAKALLQQHFEVCYPFHPATLSVFQRKWQALQTFQQTRGTLAMFAQWVSLALKDGFAKARNEPLITLGSAPLDVPEFRSVVLGQLGETRLLAAITTDIASSTAHARALDRDTKGPLRDIHKRVGNAILFESSGGQTDKTAHSPELRFAIGEPLLDTTSIDNAAHALEAKAYYLRRVGTDGFRIGYKPTVKKVVNDRRASLDHDDDVVPAMETLVKKEFERGKTLPWVPLPDDGTDVPDNPKLTLIVAKPGLELDETDGEVRATIADWTKHRGNANRAYPAALVWCLKKPGDDLQRKVEDLLAWRRVKAEIDTGTLMGEFEAADLKAVAASLKEAEEAAKDEVWASYRFIAVADAQESDGIAVIDIGAGHASGGESLCGRAIAALKSASALNESIGAGYIQRNWPPALTGAGAWPLAGLRKSFLDGSLTRLVDPDKTLQGKVCELVEKGDFGLASGQQADGSYQRLWFREPLDPADVTFDKDVFLLTKQQAEALQQAAHQPPPGNGDDQGEGHDQHEGDDKQPKPDREHPRQPTPDPGQGTVRVNVSGSIPAETWNRLGTKLLPKLKSGAGLAISFSLTADIASEAAPGLQQELAQALQDLGIADSVSVKGN